MRAVILLGHGSLRPGSGAAMIRLAARAQEAGLAPIVAAGFLNYSRPTLPETLARCVAQGADEVVVQPYFLVPGAFVGAVVPRAARAAHAAYPQLKLALAPPFGDHPALAELVLRRAAQAISQADADPPTALLLIAHGSPDPDANQPIERLVDRLRALQRYVAVELCYLDLNQPLAGPAVDRLVQQGFSRIVVVPYFLQLGGHVAEDLPELVAAAQVRHPAATIILAEHLAYDPLLVDVIASRVAEAAPVPDTRS